MKNKIKTYAFTLLEIMVVMIIVGTLAVVGLVNYSGVVERQKAEEGKNILLVLLRAQKAYAIDNGSYTNNIANLDVTIPTPKYFSAPTIALTNPIATIARVGSYSLRIDDQGVITCGTATSACAQISMSCIYECDTTP